MGILNTGENRNLVTKEFEWDCEKCSKIQKRKKWDWIHKLLLARYLVSLNVFLHRNNIFHPGF